MSIKVLHISTVDAGGAGSAALFVHRSLAGYAEDVESRMLVAKKYSTVQSVYQVNHSSFNHYVAPHGYLRRRLESLMRKHGKLLTPLEKCYSLYDKIPDSCRNVCFTFPVTDYDLSENPLVQWADIIHLHWVADFIDYDSFFRKINKPIVWTFRDENPMLGGFHCKCTRDTCYSFYKELEDCFLDIKARSIAGKQISVVALSSHMERKIKNSIFKDFPTYKIFNPVNYGVFAPVDRHSVRTILGINGARTVFLYISSTLTDPVKGLDITVRALQDLNLKDAVLICIGDGKEVVIKGMKVIQFHHQSDRIWLSSLYSAADYMISSSYQESFGNTAVEALCCGVPVVATPTGVILDIINDSNGVVADDFSPEAMAVAIKTALGRKYNRGMIRNDIIPLIEPHQIVRQHIALYRNVWESYNR